MVYLPASTPANTAAPSRAGIIAAIRAAQDIKSVADATAQATAVTDWPTLSGAAISAANPVKIYRQDTNTIRFSHDGSTWHDFPELSDSGWVAGTLDAGFTGDIWVRSLGPLVEIAAVISGTVATGAVELGDIPAGYRPDTSSGRSNPRPAAYLTGGYNAAGYVTSAGVVGVVNESGASRSGVQLRGMWTIG